MRAYRTVIRNNGLSDPNQFFTTLLTKCALLCTRPCSCTSMKSRVKTFQSATTGYGVHATVKGLYGAVHRLCGVIPGLGSHLGTARNQLNVPGSET